ncbi:MAG: glycoside hydrolase family 2 [Clostridia bacterium]|nr:glycoside hydrolase family 2 [Clostridia bacterium]
MIPTPEFLEAGIPLAEYPRPGMRRDSYLSLNGPWEYAIRPAGEVPQEYDGQILVPYPPESPASGVMRVLQPHETLTYRRRFTLPEGFFRGRLLLQLGAVDQVCLVSLNGRVVGGHEGGYTPFEVDLTPAYREGENELTVTVWDDTDTAVYGRGKQRLRHGGIWYTPVSGIWQSVWLESTPPHALTGLRILPDAERRTLSVTPFATAPGEVTVEAMDGDRVLAAATVSAGECATLDVSPCRLWSVHDPALYRLRLRCGTDLVESYFGVRSYGKKEINGKQYFTENEKPIFYNGLLDQGYWPEGLYTPPSNRALYEELARVRALGFTMLRKHCKVESALYYYYCDLLGIAVWQDMLNGGERERPLRLALAPFLDLHLCDSNYRAMGRADVRSRRQYRREAEEVQDTLYNVVSLCLYTPFNEGWGQFDALAETAHLQARDPSRLYDHASGWQDMGGGDVRSRHIYFRPARPKNDGRRILALTEFGGYSHAVRGHTFTSRRFGYRHFKDADRLAEAYARLYRREVIPAILAEGLSATVYTQLTDVEDEINGLFTYDRLAKLPEELVITLNREVAAAFCTATEVQEG